ncbi:tellurite resistance TerB family protein [Terrarubrum flagellatum]|uniref:tellurite resistance TerB family protein n=1 Tax=Terrirubrum flagellatum TaxID=2895980 RepID=UPI003144FFFE
MFDAKSLLDGLLGGAQQGGQAGGLASVLGNVLAQAQAQAQQAGLGDTLNRMREQGVGGTASSVFGQATGGLRDAASRVDQSTGASDKFNEIVGQLSGGKSPNDILAQVKQMASDNPGMATAALGGLAAAIFGTSAGRGLATNAAKLGGLATIGGLAYSAWRNHQQGKPMLDLNAAPAAAPAGSGFEPDAATNEHAELFIRAMVAAAAADGSVDANERATIIAGLQQAGLNEEAYAWLENEIAHPMSADQLAAAAAGSPELATQIYTAARISIEPDEGAESQFLKTLAAKLGLPDALVAQIEATAKAAKAA